MVTLRATREVRAVLIFTARAYRGRFNAERIE
jgi:hypothetical protein